MKTIKNLTVEELRKSILQLAIQGKLVKQDPIDEPASELVKRIYEEKKKLIAEGKIKKDKQESYIFKGEDNFYYEKVGKGEPIRLDDLPFDIPDNWTWIRLSNISEYGMGQTILKSQMNLSGIPVYSATIDDIPLGFIDNKINKIGLTYNDLVIPARGNSIGYVTHIKDNNASCTQTTIWMKLFSKEIVEYLLIYFKGFKDKLFVYNGAAIPQITISMVMKYLLPLPPLEEQIRIVNKVKELENLFFEYDCIEKELTTLENNFAEKLKKSILQYAIEGKLVKQDINDEPASILLERIKKEKELLIKQGKIKKDKNDSSIIQNDDKNYYENIPHNWILCTIADVCSYGKTIYNFTPKLGDWLLELEDIESRSSKLLNRKYVDEKTNFNSKICFGKGMILYSKLRPYLDKVIIADDNGVATSEIIPFYSYINPEYLVIFLKSPMFLERVKQLMYGVKMPRLGTDDMLNTIFLLPPLKEQYRIIDKIKTIFQLFD